MWSKVLLNNTLDWILTALTICFHVRPIHVVSREESKNNCWKRTQLFKVRGKLNFLIRQKSIYYWGSTCKAVLCWNWKIGYFHPVQAVNFNRWEQSHRHINFNPRSSSPLKLTEAKMTESQSVSFFGGFKKQLMLTGLFSRPGLWDSVAAGWMDALVPR